MTEEEFLKKFKETSDAEERRYVNIAQICLAVVNKELEVINPIVEALKECLAIIETLEISAGMSYAFERNRIEQLIENNSPAVTVLIPEKATSPVVIDDSKVLFVTVEKDEIRHGDKYYCFLDDQKRNYHAVKADAKFDYNDGVERYSLEATIKDAVEVFKWLNRDKNK